MRDYADDRVTAVLTANWGLMESPFGYYDLLARNV